MTALLRRNDVRRKREACKRIISIIFLLLCPVACGGSDGSLAQGGVNLVVVSGQARIQSSRGNTPVAEGQEAVITAGDQVMANEVGAKLLLANGSVLYLNPDTDLQVVTFSAEGTVRLSQLKGRLEVEAASPLLTVEISTSVPDAFMVKTMDFTATPTVRDTTFRLEIIDDVNAHLTVETGEVDVTNNDHTETIPAGSKVTAKPGGELIVSQIGATVGPTAVVVATADLVPTITPELTHPSPTAAATATAVPYLYPAPGLVGPADGSSFKGDETILLIWGTPTPLSEGEWYEVQFWREGDPPYAVVQRTKEGTWKVEPRYYSGRYQWRILVVRSQEGHKEMDLSPPSPTWSLGWLRPSAPVPTAPSASRAPVDLTLTIYLRGTNNAPGLATFSGEKVNAGMIYNEGGTVYGDVAVRIGGTEYHFDKPKPAPGEPEQLPAPYRLEVKFSESLTSAAEGKPGFDPQKAQFWVGKLNCDSATLPDKPYQIEIMLYAGGEIRKHSEVSFFVADAPLCGAGGKEPSEGGGGGQQPPVRP